MALSKVLQDLAEEFDKRVRSGWASDLYSLAWCNYFVAAFDRVVRDLPPYKDLDSIGELCEAIARLEITAPSDASATTTVNDKPTDTSSSDITFKVDTLGDYKARIVKEGTTTTLEFLLNGPATATVQVHRGTLNQVRLLSRNQFGCRIRVADMRYYS